MIDSTDFLPTICEAAGITPKTKTPLDGRSFLPQLQGQKGQPREWIYSWYSQSGGATASAEFAASPRYKLFRNGNLFDYLADPDEKKPLPTKDLNAEARAIERMLQGVLDNFKDARPANLRTANPKKKAEDS